MTRTTVRPLGALVGSGVGSRRSLVGSLGLVGWVASLACALVCGLAGSVAGVWALVCLAGIAGGLAGVFARWLACSLNDPAGLKNKPRLKISSGLKLSSELKF